MGVVEVDLGSVVRAWRRNDEGPVWVQVRASSGSWDAFVSATDEDEPDSYAHATRASDAAQAPAGFVVQIEGADGEEDLAAWLERFAARLERAGFSGKLRGTPSVYPPSWLTDSSNYSDPARPRTLPFVPTAFVAWKVDLDAMAADPDPRGTWFLPADDIVTICHLLTDWSRPGGPNAMLAASGHNLAVSDAPGLAGTLATGVLGNHGGGLYRYGTEQQGGRNIHLATPGSTTLAIVEGPMTWAERVAELRQAITALPHLTCQALIRPALRTTGSWTEIGYAQRLPGLHESDVRYNRHLLDRYVPDAHGIQVLGDQHLANAHDLSAWTITPLGHGRHLVEAPDLAPWYATNLPDQATVDQARRDFGDLILTTDTIAQNPAPRTGT